MREIGKSMKKLNPVLLAWVFVQSSVAVLSMPQTVLANTNASSCVNGLLYQRATFGSTRSEVSEWLAATVCRGVATEQEASSVQRCVRSLLFTPQTFGSRRNQTSEDTAVSTCSINRSAPQNSVQPSQIIIIPNPNSAPQQTQPTQRRTQKQCVNTIFNQVWDDIHCQHNNGMFEWRTVYLD
jgi:hypothetical protein